MGRKWFTDAVAAAALAMAAGCQPGSPRVGDLLFHVTETANQITDVTPDMMDHVAIVLSPDSVIEAVGRGVVVTPLDSLRRQEGYYLRAKVEGADRRRSVSNARRYLGRRYDYLYLAESDDIYCSELVLLSFVDRRGERLFEPVPMSFHDASGRITPYWTDFYARHGMAVPEGQPGSNPAELSKRKGVRIVGRLR